MRIDLTNELANLLEFVASVGIAIRMNSAYNEASQYNPHKDVDVMYLADSIHNLDILGRSIEEGRKDKIMSACEELISTFKHYLSPLPPNARMKGDPKSSFERNGDYLHLPCAIDILETIMAKVHRSC